VAADTSAPATGLKGAGAPLEPGVRDALSTSFRHDFSSVRVHTGPQAERATSALGALAYTVGNDVVFAGGAYDPLTRSGRSLIAHELAHVAQHGGSRSAPSFLRTNPTAPVAPADTRLEHQAHTAAALQESGRALPKSWAWERSTAPFLGKVDVAWTAPPSPYTVTYGNQTRTITREQWSPDDPSVARVDLGEFFVPKEKGPWGDRYDAIARGGGLQSTVEVNSGRIRADQWQQRAPTPELRRAWLLRVQWPAAQAGQWWEDAGGDHSASGDFEPRAGHVGAQIDHIVELQLGGTNVPENLAPHTGPDNEASGRGIWRMMRTAGDEAATAIARRHGGNRLRSLVLSFSSARQESGYPDVSALPVLPAEGATRQTAIANRRGRAVKALQVHNTAVADLAAGVRPTAADRDAQAAAVASLSAYPISAGPSNATLRVPARPVESDPIENSEVAENNAARELISGLILEKLTRPHTARGAHIVLGWLNSPRHPAREGTRIPLLLENEASQRVPFVVNDVGGTGRLTLQGEHHRIGFTYPYLSHGTMELRTAADGSLEGHGSITPSVPLLRRVPITVDWDRQGLRGSVQAPAERLSLPPFRVTEAALTVNITPELQAGGHVGFVLGSLVTGRVDAGVDARGLFARGDIVAHIPGLDEATGHVDYRTDTGLNGFVVARASRPSGLVRGGEVRLDFTPDGWSAGGQVDLMLPGNSPAQLSVRKAGERVVYAGRATLNVPGLRPVDAEVSYDGQHVSGSAHTTFTLLGATGDLTLRYRDGRFSGDGAVQLQRGRFTGRLEAHLDEDGVISGRGTGSVEIRPGLVGTVGIEYGRDHRLRVSGELRFPPYRFLEPRGDRYQLFQHNLPDIPIFAIPLGIGSVGLVARIGGGLAARYQFGPGEIRDMVIRAAFDPLEEPMNAELSAEARLVIPAEAGLELSVRAGIGASVVIASATGGITVTGGVLLRGGLDASARLAYAHSILTFDTNARISVQPVLTLRIEADILIEAAIGGPWRFPYELASYSYSTGLEFGMIAPFHYQSDQPLRLPQVSDIQWIVPDINVGALADRIAGQVRGGLGF
jgi:hypothetical protein